jgi:hypothetical protein
MPRPVTMPILLLLAVACAQTKTLESNKTWSDGVVVRAQL